ncbi:hypothetical protein F5Y11DRAFT_342188 [Daldinia sp. FL1419]|nr:hypothetical protein F5Y11DRAFT_342188 [Daldinia sp. FL1419]
MRTMGLNSKDFYPYETSSKQFLEDVLEPTTLMLKDRHIVAETQPNNWLYEVGGDVTAIPQKATSMTFKRIEDNRLPEVDSITSTEGQDGHIFYLAHPLGAQYRTDIPSYYLTSVAPDTPGNVGLEISRSRLGNIIFKALVSSGRSWTDHPLFNHDLELLFIAKQKWAIGHYIWTNSNNELVAYEDDKDDQHRLAITAPLRRDIRDVLVATWCLRIWHDYGAPLVQNR